MRYDAFVVVLLSRVACVCFFLMLFSEAYAAELKRWNDGVKATLKVHRVGSVQTELPFKTDTVRPARVFFRCAHRQ